MRKELIRIIIVDFRTDEDEPAFDVEVSRDGEFVGEDGGVFSTKDNYDHIALELAKVRAIKAVCNLEL